MLVELGGGTNPHPRADVVIDLTRPKNSPPQDASDTPWRVATGSLFTPLPDSQVDEVYCSHFMEHIPSGQPRLNVMNEAWRVLKPGGTFTMIMPLIGYTNPFTGEPLSNQIGWQPWADPTHVSFWWLPESVWYFCEGPFKPHADYGMEIWGPCGVYVTPEEATATIQSGRSAAGGAQSFWSVRDQWEGVVRIFKP